MNFLGILAIVIFVILFMLPNILLYKADKFKDFKLHHTIIFIVFNLIFIVMFVINFIKGKNCDKNKNKNKADCVENLNQGIYNENVRLTNF